MSVSHFTCGRKYKGHERPKTVQDTDEKIGKRLPVESWGIRDAVLMRCIRYSGRFS